MIWLSSFTSKSSLDTNQNNYRANVRNTLTETIGMVLSMASNDIIALRFLTTEPNEHNITGWIIRKREATVLEVNKMEHTSKIITRSIFVSGLQTLRRKKWIKQHPRFPPGRCKVVSSRVKFWAC